MWVNGTFNRKKNHHIVKKNWNWWEHQGCRIYISKNESTWFGPSFNPIITQKKSLKIHNRFCMLTQRRFQVYEVSLLTGLTWLLSTLSLRALACCSRPMGSYKAQADARFAAQRSDWQLKQMLPHLRSNLCGHASPNVFLVDRNCLHHSKPKT